MRTNEQLMLELIDSQDTEERQNFMLGVLVGMLFGSGHITSASVLDIATMSFNRGRTVVGQCVGKLNA